MKFLVDQPVSPTLANWLREAGHDAIHARDRGLSNASDSELVSLAIAEDRALITADLDYPRIIALSRADRPGLILFRAGNITDAQMLDLLRRVLAEVPLPQLPRSVVVIDAYSMRIASLPIRPEV